MLSEKWKNIIELLSVIHKDSININRLRLVLDCDMEVDSQVLDNLYILGIIPLEEYKARMSKYIERMKNCVEFAEKQLNTANDKGNNYNPMIFYGLNRAYFGAAIENKMTEDWNSRFNVPESTE